MEMVQSVTNHRLYSSQRVTHDRKSAMVENVLSKIGNSSKVTLDKQYFRMKIVLDIINGKTLMSDSEEVNFLIKQGILNDQYLETELEVLNDINCFSSTTGNKLH
jgi:hypothetical protein